MAAENLDYEIQIDAAPEVVFGALTTPELLCKWLCHEATVEPKVGGRFDMRWSATDAGADVSYIGDAAITQFEPGLLLAIQLAPTDGPAGSVSCIEFHTAGVDGKTELRVVQSGFKGDNAGLLERDRYTRGWFGCLKALQSLLEDEPAARLRPAPMHRDIPVPGSDPCGIEVEGGNLWLSDAGRGRIYQLDPLTGSERLAFDFDGEPAGLCYDGKFLWQADREAAVLVRIDPKTGRPSRRLRLRDVDGELGGLAWDGTHILVAIAGTHGGEVARVNPRSGAIESRIVAPVAHISGVAWDGERMWVADFDRRSVSAIDAATGAPLFRVALKGHPTGLAWDGERLWYADSEWKLASRILDDVFEP